MHSKGCTRILSNPLIRYVRISMRIMAIIVDMLTTILIVVILAIAIIDTTIIVMLMLIVITHS